MGEWRDTFLVFLRHRYLSSSLAGLARPHEDTKLSSGFRWPLVSTLRSRPNVRVEVRSGSTATTIVGRGRGRSTQNEMQNGLVWGWYAAAMGKKEWAGVGSRQD